MNKLFINLGKLKASRGRGERKNFKGICKIILRELIKNAYRIDWEEHSANPKWRHYSCKIKDYKILVATHEHPFYGDNEKTWVRNFIFEIINNGNNLASLEYRLLPARYLETTVSESSTTSPWPHLIGLFIIDIFNRAELAVKNQK